MKFKLEIRLGNEAMQTPEDVAEALRGVASQLEDGVPFDNRLIRDHNGNETGSWKVVGK